MSHQIQRSVSNVSLENVFWALQNLVPHCSRPGKPVSHPDHCRVPSSRIHPYLSLHFSSWLVPFLYGVAHASQSPRNSLPMWPVYATATYRHAVTMRLTVAATCDDKMPLRESQLESSRRWSTSPGLSEAKQSTLACAFCQVGQLPPFCLSPFSAELQLFAVHQPPPHP